MDVEGNLGCGCIVTFAIGMLAALIFSLTALPASQADVTIHVMKTETHCSNSNCKYLVFTQNQDGSAGEVFEDTDMWQFGKWNSSDVYAQLQSNHTYKVHVAGWRIPLLSWYRNILRVE